MDFKKLKEITNRPEELDEDELLRQRMISNMKSAGIEPTEEEIVRNMALYKQTSMEEPGLVEVDPSDYNPMGIIKVPIKSIVKKGFQKVDPITFTKQIEDAAKKNPHIKKMLSEYSPEELKKMGKWIDPETGSGFAVKPDGDIVNIFSATKGQGKRIIEEAKRKGGVKLDHFESGPLSKRYSEAGFKEIKREPNWTPGEPDVVYRQLSEKPGLREIVENAKKKSNVKVKDIDTSAAKPLEDMKSDLQYKRLQEFLRRK